MRYSLPLVPTLSQINPVNILSTHFFKIHFNIIYPSISMSYMYSLTFSLLTRVLYALPSLWAGRFGIRTSVGNEIFRTCSGRPRGSSKQYRVCILYFGRFRGVLILYADVSEHCQFHLHRQCKTGCYETSTHNIQKPGNHPKENTTCRTRRKFEIKNTGFPSPG